MPSHLGGINAYWWKEDEDKVHESVFAYVKHLDTKQSHKELSNIRHMRLYGNFSLLGLSANTYSVDNQSLRSGGGIGNRLTLNVIQSICDTAQAKIAKNKPKPEFLTEAGDWSQQQKAKKLSRFCQGQFYSMGIYEKGQQVFLDSAIFGTGALKIFREGNEIKAERTFINEIKVDDVEAVYGEPRQMHQTKFIHRDVLKEMFPEHTGAIDQVSTNTSNLHPSSKIADMIQVVESWHLPSGPEAKDGVRAITINNATLLKEEYDKPYFPFVFFRWNIRPLGFFGQGIAEQLQGIQLEINKILKTIQISMHLTSIPKVFVENGSKVVKSHINNEIGGIITYDGNKPSYESVSAIPAELFSQLDRLYQRAFEQSGVSQLSAISLKPAGLESGKALREFNDIETERFMIVGQRYEEFYLKICEQIIDLARDIAEDTGNYNVKVPGKDFLESIEWKDINLENDKFIMQVFPTSSLSSTPAGKLQDVQDLLAAGFVNREQAIKLLDFPDLNSITDLQTAALDNIEKMIDLMIDKGQYNPPEPFQNLALGLQTMQEAYLFHKTKGAPDSRLELLRRWMDEANALLQQAQQKQMADQQQAIMEAQLQSEEGVMEQEVAAEGEINPLEVGAEEDLPVGEGLPEGPII